MTIATRLFKNFYWCIPPGIKHEWTSAAPTLRNNEELQGQPEIQSTQNIPTEISNTLINIRWKVLILLNKYTNPCLNDRSVS